VPQDPIDYTQFTFPSGAIATGITGTGATKVLTVELPLPIVQGAEIRATSTGSYPAPVLGAFPLSANNQAYNVRTTPNLTVSAVAPLSGTTTTNLTPAISITYSDIVFGNVNYSVQTSGHSANTGSIAGAGSNSRVIPPASVIAMNLDYERTYSVSMTPVATATDK
jgi:hypothetical protein